VKVTVFMTVVGLVVGFLAGHWVTMGESEAGETMDELPNHNPEKDRVVGEQPGPAQANGPIREEKSTRVPVERDFVDLLACTREIKRLTNEVEQWTTKNAMQKKEMEFAAGKPIPFPPDLDPKYLGPALMKNLNKAYKEVGLDWDASFVDCDEFPCIVCAELKWKDQVEKEKRSDMFHEKMKELEESEAMSIYGATDHGRSVHITSNGHEERWHKCHTIHPAFEEKSANEALSNRLDWRLRRLYQSM
jgi:hypothetical protein